MSAIPHTDHADITRLGAITLARIEPKHFRLMSKLLQVGSRLLYRPSTARVAWVRMPSVGILKGVIVWSLRRRANGRSTMPPSRASNGTSSEARLMMRTLTWLPRPTCRRPLSIPSTTPNFLRPHWSGRPPRLPFNAFVESNKKRSSTQRQSPTTCPVASSGLRTAWARCNPRASLAVWARVQGPSGAGSSNGVEVVFPSADNAAPRQRVLFLGLCAKAEQVEQLWKYFDNRLSGSLQKQMECIVLDPPYSLSGDLDDAVF